MREKKERKPSDTLGFENNELYQIKSEGWEGGSFRHNTMNTTDPFLAVTQTRLPVAVPSPGETMEVEGPNSLREWRKGTATRRTVGYVKIRCVRKFQK